MAEKLCKLRKKGGGQTLPDHFDIQAYLGSGSSPYASAALRVDYNMIFPKYKQVKYELMEGTVYTCNMRNVSVGTDTPITTSWTDFPNTMKTGSGDIRFAVSTQVKNKITRVRIHLQ